MKTPTVYERHVIIIDGVEYIQKGMEWTESINQAINDEVIPNDVNAILEYIQNQ